MFTCGLLMLHFLVNSERAGQIFHFRWEVEKAGRLESSHASPCAKPRKALTFFLRLQGYLRASLGGKYID